MLFLRSTVAAVLSASLIAIATPATAHTHAQPNHTDHNGHDSHNTATTPDTAEVAPEPTISIIPVADGVYMLVGEGGNIGLSVGEDGVLAIDSQFAPLTEKIQAAITTLSDQPIRFLLNTHWHFDHTGGNENFSNSGTVIVAHNNVRERMSRDQFIAGLGMDVPASTPAALPIVTFSEDISFHFNGETIHATHVNPAHTDGDSIVHFPTANVIHTGDIYFNGLYPFIDVSSGGGIDGMIAAVDRVLALADDETQIIPGHGALSNKAELEEYRGMLVTVRSRMQAAIETGASIDQILTMDLNTDYDATLGNGFLSPEQFTRILYADLTR
ncbi:MAG: MBL fold metallo-hydrolase [Oscillatoriales cyanobacterium]|nr:MAG: MBL fold metallo-hydrolase [Oscillatoriales cyanobacterium]